MTYDAKTKEKRKNKGQKMLQKDEHKSKDNNQKNVANKLKTKFIKYCKKNIDNI